MTDVISCDFTAPKAEERRLMMDEDSAYELLKLKNREIACNERDLESLKADNVRLRKILAHVPGLIAIKAKEAAGFAAEIKMMDITEECDHEWEIAAYDHSVEQCSICDEERVHDPPRFADDAI